MEKTDCCGTLEGIGGGASLGCVEKILMKYFDYGVLY